MRQQTDIYMFHILSPLSENFHNGPLNQYLDTVYQKKEPYATIQWRINGRPLSTGIRSEERTRNADEMFPVYQVLIDKEQGSLSDLRKDRCGQDTEKPVEGKYMTALFCAQLTKIRSMDIRGRQSRL